jgi:hypothetical protein
METAEESDDGEHDELEEDPVPTPLHQDAWPQHCHVTRILGHRQLLTCCVEGPEASTQRKLSIFTVLLLLFQLLTVFFSFF